MLEKLLALDEQLLIYLNTMGSEQYDDFWLFITDITHSFPLFAILFIIKLKKLPVRKALILIFSTLVLLGVILVLTELTKMTVQRLRPMNVDHLEGVIRELVTTQNYSFFSGHTATSFGLSAFLILLMRKEWKWIYTLWIWAILFSYSRIYVGAHYPLDIIVGAVVGALLAWGAYKILSIPRFKQYLL